MLRHSETFAVNEAHMQALREIADATHVNGRINNSKRGGYTVDNPNVFQLGSLFFTLSEEEGKRSIPHAGDALRITNAIREAKENMDYVVIYLHSHEIKGETDDEPDYFLETFARQCIDASAAAVICSGTHQIKAVEVYKGAPILYSIHGRVWHSHHTASTVQGIQTGGM